MNQQPFLSWCLIARNEAGSGNLERCLASLRERTPDAEIVVVDTCSSDNTVEVAKKFGAVVDVYRGPDGDWTTEMPWFDDAAAARNRSIELAKGKVIGWIDADDVLCGPEETTRLLKLNKLWREPDDRSKLTDGKAIAPLEETLKQAFEDDEMDCLWAYYLYRPDAEGKDHDTHPRERFVRNDGNWVWRSEGHEVLVEKDPKYVAKKAFLDGMLFVHTKKFTHDDTMFSVNRHFEILYKAHENGTATTRDYLYLANYAPIKAPERQKFFIDQAYAHGATKRERYLSLIRAARWFSLQGFRLEMEEAIAASTGLLPDLPDAWVMAGELYSQPGYWSQAANHFLVAQEKKPNQLASEITSRTQTITYKAHAVWACVKAGDERVSYNLFEDAIAYYTKAEKLGDELRNDPAIGLEGKEATDIWAFARHKKNSLETFFAWKKAFDFCVSNDEPIKANAMFMSAPSTFEEYPLFWTMRDQAKSMVSHLQSEEAYAEFYAKSEGATISNEADLDRPEQLGRICWLAASIEKWRPEANVLEVGPFDGVTAIPLLKSCHSIKYTGVETYKVAADLLRERIERMVPLPERARVIDGILDSDGVLMSPEGKAIHFSERFDAIVFYEVIEHVADPVKVIRGLLGLLSPGGRLFISTPHGAFDRGYIRPQFKNTMREPGKPMGHVRAITPLALTWYAEEAGGRVITLKTGAQHWGSSLQCEIEVMPLDLKKPVTFAVEQALWDWNASYLIQNGMGASEECIVYAARQLADERQVDVYTQVPHGIEVESEVHSHVGYWPKSQSLLMDKDSTIVVSRWPQLGGQLKKLLQKDDLDLVLWLQDTHYPVMKQHPELAKDYRKIICVSEWHKLVTLEEHKLNEPEQIDVIPNFLLREHFQIKDKPKREPFHFIYASSPDRGVVRLLQLWPQIKNRWPDATLDIFYGWRGFGRLMTDHASEWTKLHREQRTAFLDLVGQDGVKDRGMINHADLAREMMRASVFAYPTHFHETDCLTARKMRAAGAVPVVTALAGLNESAKSEWSHLIPLSDGGVIDDAFVKRFLAGIEIALATPEQERALMSEQAIAEECWEARAPLWERVLAK